MTIFDKFYMTFIQEDRYLYFWDGLKMTLLLTITSFLFGCIIGAVFCGLKRSKKKSVRVITDAVADFFIQIPTMVLLMFFVYILFGPSGVSIIIIVIIGLTIKAGAYLSEIFTTASKTVYSGEIEAARTLGMTKSQAFFKVELPQAIHAGMPIFQNQFVSTLQETSVVGYLAIVDLTRASSIVTTRTLDAFFGLVMVSVIYLIVGKIGQTLLGLLDRKKHIGGQNVDSYS